MSGSSYLADTTAFVVQGRDQSVNRRFVSLLSEGRLAACQMSAMEYLNNAPDPKGYEIVRGALHGMRWVDVTTQAMDRALDVHRKLGATSQHRHFSLPDLIIAATAELNGATVCTTTPTTTGSPRSLINQRNGLPRKGPCSPVV
jgi:predicted nucleic acid-binding protein